jgi:UDP-GlcNAc:undecaprenyl-phosphate GlcNAc-1-phosphate transferase
MQLAALLQHLAFAAALAVLSAMIVRAMIMVRIMDIPVARSAHDAPIPRGGGLGVVAAVLTGLGTLYFSARYGRLEDPYFVGVILGFIAIAAVSLADDIFGFAFVWKLAAQLVAAVVAVANGLYLDVLFLPIAGPVPLGAFGIPFTIAWILFMTNAMNFVDGLNGLCAGIAAIAGAALAILAAAEGGNFVYFGALLLTAGCLGFLPFNFPRARIFLGDVGSQAIGYWLAVLAVAAARFDATQVPFFLVPILLAAPLFDVAFTLMRRLLAGARLADAHRGHLYQVAQRAGIGALWITLIHWGFALVHAFAALAYLRSGPMRKLWIVLGVLAGQALWAAFVAWRARARAIGTW